jgi:hypothetical protein
MITSERQISSDIARQILGEAELHGLAVEDYLKTIAGENQADDGVTLPKVRKVELNVDLSQSRKWLKENRHQYIGKWVVLDGEKFIGASENPKDLVEQARSEGVEIPFVKFIEDETEPFSGTWL